VPGSVEGSVTSHPDLVARGRPRDVVHPHASGSTARCELDLTSESARVQVIPMDRAHGLTVVSGSHPATAWKLRPLRRRRGGAEVAVAPSARHRRRTRLSFIGWPARRSAFATRFLDAFRIVAFIALLPSRVITVRRHLHHDDGRRSVPPSWFPAERIGISQNT
jgi:hypothetical protein